MAVHACNPNCGKLFGPFEELFGSGRRVNREVLLVLNYVLKN
jgi:hypothetical protein